MLKLSTTLTLTLKSTRIWYQEIKYQLKKAPAQKIFTIGVINSDNSVDDEIKLIVFGIIFPRYYVKI